MWEFEQAYERLLSRASTLHTKTVNALPEMRHALDPASSLPPGCPSRARLALMALRGVEQSLDELREAFQDVVKTLGNRS
jgi:hypothetical protein